MKQLIMSLVPVVLCSQILHWATPAPGRSWSPSNTPQALAPRRGPSSLTQRPSSLFPLSFWLWEPMGVVDLLGGGVTILLL